MPHRNLRNWFRLRPWSRHGVVLAVAGLVYVGIGYGYVNTNPSEGREDALRLALVWMPLCYWGAVFVLAGVLAILSSRWPIFSQTWGYTVLTGLSSLWAGAYIGGVAMGSSIQNLTGALLFGLLGFMWWVVSGLVNPSTGRAE